jgi:hypothetical protein
MILQTICGIVGYMVLQTVVKTVRQTLREIVFPTVF